MNRRSRRLAWVAAAAATVLLPVWLLWSWTTGRRAVELATEGGVVQLRDPLRPIRGTTRLLVVALDGVGDADLRRAIHDGHLPSVARLTGRATGEDQYERASAVPDAVSVLPSSTMGAWATVFTGSPPGVTGIPGNEWYIRDERRFLVPGPVSVEDYQHTIAMFTEDLLGRVLDAPTLFERLDLRAHVALMPILRGADLLVVPSVRDVAHGSPEAQDSRIPILVAHAARRGEEIRDVVRSVIGEEPSQLDIVPLIERLLAASPPAAPAAARAGR